MTNVVKKISSKTYFKKCTGVNHQIEFYAMRRSGHHAIMEWLFYHIKEPIFFINDIEPVIKNKNYKDSGVWKNPIKSGEYSNYFQNYSFNYEDASPEKLQILMRKYYTHCLIKKPEKISKIFIIRDPFNLFASRLKFFKEKKLKNITASGSGWSDEKAVSLWCEYAREYLGETRYIPDRVFIDYNKWCSDSKYRAKIITPFNKRGEYLDEGRGRVPPNGGGSSFDSREYNGKGEQMKTQERWSLMLDDPDYMRIFENKKLIELSEKIYPDLTERVLSGIR
jgi:hypothetical protein